MTTVTHEKLDRLYDAYKNGSISRRHFLKYLGLAGASLGLVGMPFGRAVQEAWAAKSIRFDGWGGSVSEAFRPSVFAGLDRCLLGLDAGLGLESRELATCPLFAFSNALFELVPPRLQTVFDRSLELGKSRQSPSRLADEEGLEIAGGGR